MLAPYLLAAVRAWIKGLKATKVAWNQSAHSFEDTGFPDHKVRSDCAQKIVEYLVGKAIERSMEISGSYKELSEVLADLEKSPEAKRLLPAEVFDSLHKASSVESAPATVEEKLFLSLNTIRQMTRVRTLNKKQGEQISASSCL